MLIGLQLPDTFLLDIDRPFLVFVPEIYQLL